MEATATGVQVMRESMMTRFKAVLHDLRTTALNSEERGQLEYVEAMLNKEDQIGVVLECVQRILDARIQGYVRNAVAVAEVRGYLAQPYVS